MTSRGSQTSENRRTFMCGMIFKTGSRHINEINTVTDFQKNEISKEK